MDIDYSIEVLDLCNKNLTVLPDLSKYTKLKVLKCFGNQLTSLDNLPPGLTILYCWNNKLMDLDNLPPGLKELYCGNDEWKMKYFEKTNSSRPL